MLKSRFSVINWRADATILELIIGKDIDHHIQPTLLCLRLDVGLPPQVSSYRLNYHCSSVYQVGSLSVLPRLARDFSFVNFFCQLFYLDLFTIWHFHSFRYTLTSYRAFKLLSDKDTAGLHFSLCQPLPMLGPV